MAQDPEALGRGHDLHCEYNGCSVELRPGDLSQAGVFVSTTDPPRMDSELELRLCSQLGEIAVRCQVVQVISRARAAAEHRSPGFGVLFFDLSDDQRAFIGLTLDALARAERARSAEAAAREKLAQRRQNTLRELEHDLQAQRDKSPWALLGLTPDAPPEDVRRAYLQQSKRYHPHVYAHLDSPEITQAATELFIAQKRAYTALQSLRPAASPAAASSATAAPSPTETVNAEPQQLLVPVPPAEPPLPLVPRASRTPPAEAQPQPTTPSQRPQALKARSGIGMKPLVASRGPGAPRPPQAAALPRGAPTAQTCVKPRRRSAEADAELALQEGLKHLAAGRFEPAAAQLAEAQQLCPELRDATIWLHVCRARQWKACGQDDAALEEYRALLELEPSHREALEHVGGPRRARGKLMGKWFRASDE